MTGTRIQDMAREWLKDPDFVREYEALEEEFSLVDALIRSRSRANLTQEALAARMGTSQPTIARIEAGHMPSLKTLRRLAEALDCRLRISFEPKEPAAAVE